MVHAAQLAHASAVETVVDALDDPVDGSILDPDPGIVGHTAWVACSACSACSWPAGPL